MGFPFCYQGWQHESAVFYVDHFSDLKVSQDCGRSASQSMGFFDGKADNLIRA
jgi:hypothetical protein